MLVELSVNTVICYGSSASLLWFSEPSEIVSKSSCQMIATCIIQMENWDLLGMSQQS